MLMMGNSVWLSYNLFHNPETLHLNEKIRILSVIGVKALLENADQDDTLQDGLLLWNQALKSGCDIKQWIV